MRQALVAVLLALPAGASAPEPLFDGSARTTPTLPPAPRAPAGVEIAAKKPKPVPDDLIQAKARVGNEAMLARLTPRAPREPFTFGVIGDAEHGRFWWERIFSPEKAAFVNQWRALQAAGVDFAFQLGDFVSEGDAESYREHVALVEKEAVKPLLRCAGNHDRSRPNGDADKSLYDAVFGPRDYFFDRGGWRFVSLDSSDRKVTGAQLAWLKAALSVPGPKVIFTHVPPDYIKSITPLKEVGALEEWPADKTAQDEQKGYLRDFFTNYFQDGSSEFEDLVTDNGVKAVYMGHIHAFWAADHRGVRYVISGGGGSPLYPLPPGYPKKKFAHTLNVAVTPSGLVETVVPYKGKAFVLPPVKP
ncbi:MAG: metallophosphoesterase [Elusimicrobia bacterium]|nr:metallophosphoesterase [Elusimicrobiota bacterium]